MPLMARVDQGPRGTRLFVRRGLVLPMLHLQTTGSEDEPNAKPRAPQGSGISKVFTTVLISLSFFNTLGVCVNKRVGKQDGRGWGYCEQETGALHVFPCKRVL